MVKNILITGASGFLGIILKESLSKDNDRIISLGMNKANDYVCDLSFEVPVLNRSLEIVIHAAGKAHSVPKTEEEEKEFYDANHQGTINLCKAIDNLEIAPKAFIFISTIAVYGLETGTGIIEDSPLLGATPYAKSKIQAESYLQAWAKKDNITLGILRLPLIAGPHPPGNLGAMIKGIKTGKYLSIGKANARKSIVWAEDIAKLIPKLAEVGGVYNLTDGFHPSFMELEKSISTALNKSKPIAVPLLIAKGIAKIGDMLGSKAPINTNKLNKITSTLTFDDSKARNQLGWNPTKVIDKIVEIV